jgi:broad specificity phosphatase PhoE
MRRRDFLLTAVAAALAPRRAAALGADLAQRLRGGGFNIYFRHSLTMRAGQPDDDIMSCAGQRNLTEAGVALAREIGRGFRALRIPVGDVLSSPYCRCVDTARWAFGRVAVAEWLETDGNPQGAAERARLLRLKAALVSPPPAGVNIAFVAHGNNLMGLAQVHGWPRLPIEEAEAAIFQPAGNGIPAVVALVKAAEWNAIGAG